jgi:hypothetical protein
MATSRTSFGWGLLLLAAFGAGAALRGIPSPAHAQEGGISGGVVAVTAPGRGVGHNVLFVVDQQGQHLLVYEHTTGGALELVQARDYQWDALLKDFPSQKDKKNPRRQKPSVEVIRKAVKGK